MTTFAILAVAVAVLVVVLFALRGKSKGRPVPEALRAGQPLPDFTAIDETGSTVSSGDLRGHATILLFVRGNWCPFCSSQVQNLSDHYKAIIDLGARLILLTPKPLETTRRVAEFFEVDFDFWLDEDLAITRSLGLLMESGVPKKHRGEYGEDTIWPTALVIDAEGIIRFVELSRYIADRPNPKTLLRELKAAVQK